jgi:mycothiol synthase
VPHRRLKQAGRTALKRLAGQPTLGRLLELGAQEILDILGPPTGLDERVLYQWRVALVAGPEPEPRFRPFCRADSDAVLALNQRSFAWHPEQGRWSLKDLDAVISSDRFDPDDLMVYEHDGRIVAFFHAWLADEPVSRCAHLEVFAIDSEATGRGLGSQLSGAIVSHMLRRGAEVILTYTEATNLPVNLILLRWGGVIHRIDRRRNEHSLAIPHVTRGQP